MRVTAYDLAPRGPMHFGERGVGVETANEACRADTLFGAICFAVLELEGTARLEAMLAAFKAGEPPFLISSGSNLVYRKGSNASLPFISLI